MAGWDRTRAGAKVVNIMLLYLDVVSSKDSNSQRQKTSFLFLT